MLHLCSVHTYELRCHLYSKEYYLFFHIQKTISHTHFIISMLAGYSYTHQQAAINLKFYVYTHKNICCKFPDFADQLEC